MSRGSRFRWGWCSCWRSLLAGIAEAKGSFPLDHRECWDELYKISCWAYRLYLEDNGVGIVGFEHVKVGLYSLLRTLRWITKISILQAEEQMLDYEYLATL